MNLMNPQNGWLEQSLQMNPEIRQIFHNEFSMEYIEQTIRTELEQIRIELDQLLPDQDVDSLMTVINVYAVDKITEELPPGRQMFEMPYHNLHHPLKTINYILKRVQGMRAMSGIPDIVSADEIKIAVLVGLWHDDKQIMKTLKTDLKVVTPFGEEFVGHLYQKKSVVTEKEGGVSEMRSIEMALAGLNQLTSNGDLHLDSLGQTSQLVQEAIAATQISFREHGITHHEASDNSSLIALLLAGCDLEDPYTKRAISTATNYWWETDGLPTLLEMGKFDLRRSFQQQDLESFSIEEMATLVKMIKEFNALQPGFIEGLIYNWENVHTPGLMARYIERISNKTDNTITVIGNFLSFIENFKDNLKAQKELAIKINEVRKLYIDRFNSVSNTEEARTHFVDLMEHMHRCSKGDFDNGIPNEIKLIQLKAVQQIA